MLSLFRGRFYGKKLGKQYKFDSDLKELIFSELGVSALYIFCKSFYFKMLTVLFTAVKLL